MNSETNAWRSVFLGAIATLLFCSAFLIPARSEEKPRAKVIELDSHEKIICRCSLGLLRPSP